jgi:hypothetical protein
MQHTRPTSVEGYWKIGTIDKTPSAHQKEGRAHGGRVRHEGHIGVCACRLAEKTDA